MRKRFRTPAAKEGELLVKYGQQYGEHDLFYCYPANECGMRADSRLLVAAFESVAIHDGKTLRTLLEERGYDITTLKLTVKKLAKE